MTTVIVRQSLPPEIVRIGGESIGGGGLTLADVDAEIADYLAGGDRAAYLGPAPAPPPSTFVIFGDQNADPVDGGSVPGAIAQLLDHPKVARYPAPRSPGAAEAARLQAGANHQHKGDPAEDTADFDDRSVGNLRADYVLPSRDLRVVGSGVFWPEAADPLARLVRISTSEASVKSQSTNEMSSRVTPARSTSAKSSSM